MLEKRKLTHLALVDTIGDSNFENAVQKLVKVTTIKSLRKRVVIKIQKCVNKFNKQYC